MPKLKIALIHDLVCSWSPIGFRYLSTALDILGFVSDVELSFLPFQLNPDMPAEGEEINAHLARRTGQTKEQLAKYRTDLIATGKAAGIVFDFSKRTHYYNTYRAHLLLNAAHRDGHQVRMINALHQAYYTEGRDIFDVSVLTDIANNAGFDEAFIDYALNSEENRNDMRAKEELVSGLEIRSVPTFLVNDSTLITGSNSVDFFVERLRETMLQNA